MDRRRSMVDLRRSSLGMVSKMTHSVTGGLMRLHRQSSGDGGAKGAPDARQGKSMSKELLAFVRSMPARACDSSIKWIESLPADMPAAEGWVLCQRGDWLLWLAGYSRVDRKKVVLAACACARTSLVHVASGEERPRIAIETAERWTRSEATIGEVRSASAFASASPFAASAFAAEAAAASAFAAFAAEAAEAAFAAAFAADAAADASARKASLARSAELVREVISWEDIVRGAR